MTEYICIFDGDEYVLSPDSDRIELVRCKDCDWYIPYGTEDGFCDKCGMETHDEGYCARGVRREDAGQ